MKDIFKDNPVITAYQVRAMMQIMIYKYGYLMLFGRNGGFG